MDSSRWFSQKVGSLRPNVSSVSWDFGDLHKVALIYGPGQPE